MPRSYNRRCAKGGAHKGCAPKPDLSVYASSCDGLPLDSAWMKSSPSGKQVGGGYFLDVGAKLVGGQAPIGGYSECCPPVFKTTNPTATNSATGSSGSASQASTSGMGAGFSKSGVMLSNTGKPLCGGGNRKSRRPRKTQKRRNSKKNRVSKNTNRSKGNRKSNRNRKRNSTKRNRGNKKRRNTKSKQNGGGDGLPSVFTPDMTQRSFGCRQPSWDAKCV